MMLLFKANVVTDFLQIGIGEFLVKCKRFQTMKVAFLLPVFYKGLCLVEVDVRMVAQPLYATTVQVDEVDARVSMENQDCNWVVSKWISCNCVML